MTTLLEVIRASAVLEADGAAEPVRRNHLHLLPGSPGAGTARRPSLDLGFLLGALRHAGHLRADESVQLDFAAESAT
jgi:hypothetical protein